MSYAVLGSAYATLSAMREQTLSGTHIVIAEDKGSVSGSFACVGTIAGRNGVVGDKALVGSRWIGDVAEILSGDPLRLVN